LHLGKSQGSGKLVTGSKRRKKGLRFEEKMLLTISSTKMDISELPASGYSCLAFTKTAA